MENHHVFLGKSTIITIFSVKTHYEWPSSIAMLVHQLVHGQYLAASPMPELKAVRHVASQLSWDAGDGYRLHILRQIHKYIYAYLYITDLHTYIYNHIYIYYINIYIYICKYILSGCSIATPDICLVQSACFVFPMALGVRKAPDGS